MPTRVRYEWTMEDLDENCDVIDCDFSDKLDFFSPPRPDQDLGLCRCEHDTFDDDLKERSYAYVDKETGDLDTEFDDGRPVPKRLIAEFEKWRAGCQLNA